MSDDHIIDWNDACVAESLYLAKVRVPGIETEIHALINVGDIGEKHSKVTLEIMLKNSRDGLNYLAAQNRRALGAGKDYQQALGSLRLKEGQRLGDFLCVHFLNLSGERTENINIYELPDTVTAGKERLSIVERNVTDPIERLGKALPGWEIELADAAFLKK